MKHPAISMACTGLLLGVLLTPFAQAQTRGGGQGGSTGGPTGGGSTGGGSTGGGSTGGNTGGSTGGTTSPGNTKPTPNWPSSTPSDRTPQFDTIQRSVFLSGKVMMDDGAPPPEAVQIERVCGGMHRPEGYTDSKGRFSIELGRNQGYVDASVGSGEYDPFGSTVGGQPHTMRGNTMGTDQRLAGCDLRASLPGYRSDLVNLSGRRVLDNPDIGTIILHRIGNVEGTTISATSLQAPKDAKKLYDKGIDAARKQKWDDAQKHLEKALEIYPKYAAAWFALGQTQQQGRKDMAAARQSYAKALQADAKYVKPYLAMAEISMGEQKWQDVVDSTSKLLRLDPIDYPNALLMNAVAHANLRQLDEAEKSAREAIRLDTDHQYARAEYVLGFVLANKQDYPAALEAMKRYVTRMPNAPDAEGVRKQIAQLEKMAEKP